MKAGILEHIEHLEVKEVPDPQLEKGSVLLRIRVCSICGTDLRIYHHGHSRIRLPQILGHEIAGEVVAVGEGVTNQRVDDRVAITPRIVCGECFYCRKGQPIYCENSRSFGYQLPGGYAEFLLVPPLGVKFGVINKIAQTLSFEEASLAETLACCLRAHKASRVSAGDTLVVIGGGPVGIMHCRLAKANNAGKTILVERAIERLEQVNLTSIDEIVDSGKSKMETEILSLTMGKGADVVIVACSSPQAQAQSFSLAGKGGRINFFGGLPPSEAYISISDLITHKFPLEDIEKAFLFAETRQGMHTAILP
jgi:L-iditol 2-dehydrogenase